MLRELLTNKFNTLPRERKILLGLFGASVFATCLIFFGARIYFNPETCPELTALFCGMIIGAFIFPFFLTAVVSGLFVFSFLLSKLLLRLGIGKNAQASQINPRWLWLFIGGSFVVGTVSSLGFIGSFSKPSKQNIFPSPRASAAQADTWKTYKNDVLGFSFAYPHDWKMQPVSGLSPELDLLEQANFYVEEPSGKESKLMRFDVNKLPIDDAIAQLDREIGHTGYVVQGIDPFIGDDGQIMNHIRYARLGYSSDGPLAVSYFYVSTPANQTLIFQCYFDHLNEMEEILQRRLKLWNPSAIVSGWHTYRSYNYSFEFSYPNELKLSELGPNSAQYGLDTQESISGTVPPSYETVKLVSDRTAEWLDFEIFYPLERLKADQPIVGDCGSHQADETLVNRMIHVGGLDLLERRQRYGDSFRIDYCFISGSGNLVVFKAHAFKGIKIDRIEEVDKLMRQILGTVKITSLSAITGGWKTYKRSGSLFSLKYPPEFSLESRGNGIEIISPSLSCKTAVTGTEEVVATPEMRITITPHDKNGDTIWYQEFGFDATSYDGAGYFDGRRAIYFHEGAESMFGRTAYVVYVSDYQSLVINVFTLNLAYDCKPPHKSPMERDEIVDKILATIKF